jgi:hypothetical protein
MCRPWLVRPEQDEGGGAKDAAALAVLEMTGNRFRYRGSNPETSDSSVRFNSLHFL